MFNDINNGCVSNYVVRYGPEMDDLPLLASIFDMIIATIHPTSFAVAQQDVSMDSIRITVIEIGSGSRPHFNYCYSDGFYSIF